MSSLFSFDFDVERASFSAKVAVAVLVPLAFWLSLRQIRRAGSAPERAEFLANLASGVVVFVLSNSTFVGLKAIVERLITSPGPWRIEQPVLAFLVAFVLVDLANYAYHVLAHALPQLWAFHVVHHSGRHFNLSLGPRQSWIERALVTPFCYFIVALPICWGLNLSFWYVLLGHQIVYFIGFVNHTTWFERWPCGLDRLLVNPIEHRIHHGIEERHFDCNFGFALRIWDVLFGTYRAPDAPMLEIAVGVVDCPFSNRVLEVQGQAFSHLAQLARKAYSALAFHPRWRPAPGDIGSAGR